MRGYCEVLGGTYLEKGRLGNRRLRGKMGLQEKIVDVRFLGRRVELEDELVDFEIREQTRESKISC